MRDRALRFSFRSVDRSVVDGNESDLDKSVRAPGDCNDDVEFELELEDDGGVEEMPLLSTFKDGEMMGLPQFFCSLPCMISWFKVP